MVEGLKQGPWVTIDESGDTIAIINFKDDILDGVAIMFQDGIMIDSTNHLNGKIDGTFKSWYPNGQLKFQGHKINGKQRGRHRSYHPNGQLRQEFILSDSGFVGRLRTYYSNGQIEMDGPYTDGVVTVYDSLGTEMVKILMGEQEFIPIDTLFVDREKLNPPCP
jgi:antitoxin component YwqK of YwqJK toxin-antitoxin module